MFSIGAFLVSGIYSPSGYWFKVATLGFMVCCIVTETILEHYYLDAIKCGPHKVADWITTIVPSILLTPSMGGPTRHGSIESSGLYIMIALAMFFAFGIIRSTTAAISIRVFSARHVHCRHGGFCACCQYNLTGNTSGVCPECGTKIADKSEVAHNTDSSTSND